MKKIIGTIVLVLGILAALAGQGACQEAKVAVFPFKNNGQPQQNGLASGLAAMFTTDLTKAKGIEVVDPQKVVSALAKARLAGGAPSMEDALRAAAQLEADYAVMGEFVVFGSRFRIDVRVYDVRASTMKAAEKAQAKEDSLFDMVDELSNKVVLAISGALPVVGGAVQVSSEPPGAGVLIDGDKAGDTPLVKRELNPGLHKIEVSLEGYQAYTETVVVKPDETVKLEVKLVRLFGGLRVWWRDLPMSDISVAGETIKATQFQGTYMLGKYCRNMPAGSYTVSARLPYKDENSWDNTRTWKTYAADVDVVSGEVTDIFIDNDLFKPGIQVGKCGPCGANWDFTTTLSWYELK